METEVTTTGTGLGGGGGVAPEAEVFGTRPNSGRPHSMSLYGAANGPATAGGAAGLELLIGIGIGAAVMYYLDPDGGARRRATARDQIQRAVNASPETLEAIAHEVTVGAGDWSPAVRLLSGTIGGALTLFAARRRDAIGAAAAVVGSGLLAGGVRRARSRGPAGGSEVFFEPSPGEVGNAVERPRLLEQM